MDDPVQTDCHQCPAAALFRRGAGGVDRHAGVAAGVRRGVGFRAAAGGAEAEQARRQLSADVECGSGARDRRAAHAARLLRQFGQRPNAANSKRSPAICGCGMPGLRGAVWAKRVDDEERAAFEQSQRDGRLCRFRDMGARRRRPAPPGGRSRRLLRHRVLRSARNRAREGIRPSHRTASRRRHGPVARERHPRRDLADQHHLPVGHQPVPDLPAGLSENDGYGRGRAGAERIHVGLVLHQHDRGKHPAQNLGRHRPRSVFLQSRRQRRRARRAVAFLAHRATRRSPSPAKPRCAPARIGRARSRSPTAAGARSSRRRQNWRRATPAGRPTRCCSPGWR